MGLAINMRVLYSHLFFFRDGAAFISPSAGTASRTSKPGANDTAWIDLGVVENVAPDPTQGTEETLQKGTPGLRRDYDIIEVDKVLEVRFQLQEISALSWEMIWQSLALTDASTQFNPLEGAVKKGWLKIQPYDQGDNEIGPIDLYGRLKLASAPTFGKNRVTADMTFKVLHSTLNTGGIA